MLVTECLIQDGERCIEKGDGVARDEDKAVIESLVGMPDIPAHRPAEKQCDKSMHLGAGSARMSALPVIEHDINILVDAVLDFFPVTIMFSPILDAPVRVRPDILHIIPVPMSTRYRPALVKTSRWKDLQLSCLGLFLNMHNTHGNQFGSELYFSGKGELLACPCHVFLGSVSCLAGLVCFSH